jgi:hypothetical protein
MFGFFRRKKSKAATQSIRSKKRGSAPGTEISYYADLVPELLDDHQVLLGLFTEVTQTYEAKDYERLPTMLGEFGSLLRGHLLKENIKLYIYLQHALADDPENSALMQEFRTEMHGISKTVSKFLKHYSEEDWGEQRRAEFGTDLGAIGKVLVKRIETEESVLYPLYMSPESYA